MLRKVNLKPTLISGLIAGILFSIPVFFVIRDNMYSRAWLLYMGNFLFLIEIWIHTIRENKLRRENESTVALVFISHMATIAGIVVSCLLCFILLVAMVPGYFEGGIADKALVGEPANTVRGNTNGLSFKIFLSATVIHFSVGRLPELFYRFMLNVTRRATPRILRLFISMAKNNGSISNFKSS